MCSQWRRKQKGKKAWHRMRNEIKEKMKRQMRANSGQTPEWQSESEAFLIRTEQKAKKQAKNVGK